MSDCILIRMDGCINRRELGFLLAGATLVRAQDPEPLHSERGGADSLDAAAQYRHDAASELARFKLPMMTEPAFEFRP